MYQLKSTETSEIMGMKRKATENEENSLKRYKSEAERVPLKELSNFAASNDGRIDLTLSWSVCSDSNYHRACEGTTNSRTHELNILVSIVEASCFQHGKRNPSTTKKKTKNQKRTEIQNLSEQNLPIRKNSVSSLLCTESILIEDQETSVDCSSQQDLFGTIEEPVKLKPNSAGELNFFRLLPQEIQIQIFRFVDCSWYDFIRLRLVCKEWSELLKDKHVQAERLRFLEEQTQYERYENMVSNENKHHSQIVEYLSNIQKEINADMRAILIDWLLEVTAEFELHIDTAFLSIYYLDRYLSAVGQPIQRSKLQLVGITTLVLAAKYDEIYAPTINEVAFICDNAYSNQEILQTEINILNTLKFDMTICTLKQFLEHYLKVTEIRIPKRDLAKFQLTRHFASYLSELSLVDYRFIRYRPSLMAAAVVSLALSFSGLSPWILKEPPRSQSLCYSHNDIIGCARELHDLYSRAKSMTQLVTVQKYGQPDFGSVSNVPIHPFALEIPLETA